MQHGGLEGAARVASHCHVKSANDTKCGECFDLPLISLFSLKEGVLYLSDLTRRLPFTSRPSTMLFDFVQRVVRHLDASYPPFPFSRNVAFRLRQKKPPANDRELYWEDRGKRYSCGGRSG